MNEEKIAAYLRLREELASVERQIAELETRRNRLAMEMIEAQEYMTREEFGEVKRRLEE